MLDKLEKVLWAATALFWAISILGFAVVSTRAYTRWAMMPALLSIFAVFVVGKINRTRRLAAASKAAWNQAREQRRAQG